MRSVQHYERSSKGRFSKGVMFPTIDVKRYVGLSAEGDLFCILVYKMLLLFE